MPVRLDISVGSIPTSFRVWVADRIDANDCTRRYLKRQQRGGLGVGCHVSPRVVADPQPAHDGNR